MAVELEDGDATADSLRATVALPTNAGYPPHNTQHSTQQHSLQSPSYKYYSLRENKLLVKIFTSLQEKKKFVTANVVLNAFRPVLAGVAQ